MEVKGLHVPVWLFDTDMLVLSMAASVSAATNDFVYDDADQLTEGERAELSGSLNLTEHEDVFLYSDVQRTEKATDDDTRSSGGGSF